jgi:hypothetical protein
MDMIVEQDILPSKSYASEQEHEGYKSLVAAMRNCPIPDNEVLANLGLFLNRTSFGRMQFLYQLYLKALRTHGVIMEFGTRWGQSLALFTTFRNMHEPYNFSRKVIGFDTFQGFPGVGPQDGSAPTARTGALSVTRDWEVTLSQVLVAHEKLAPRNHIRKFELVKGDVTQTLPAYLEKHPETIIALAYFDLDLYEPTKKCLELIRPHLAKNSVIGFDELALEEYPGETVALKEVWGLGNFEIIRDPISPLQSYIVVG